MKILQIVNPVMPIPPKTIGGVERVVHFLVQDLVQAGHDVTLLAEDTSEPPKGVTFHGVGTYWHQENTVRRVWSHLARYGGRYDVIHNHGRLLFYLPRIWSKAAKVHTWHSGDILVPQLKKFLRLSPRRLAFVPCGQWITKQFEGYGGTWKTIPHGLPSELYRPGLQVDADAPLVMIGRMDPRKGIADGIRVALATGRKLVIAGVIGDQPHEKAWFEENVRRHCDGKQIQFIGPVTDQQKQDLLSRAAAFLLPLHLSEAFGMVMIEALACGCPVIAYDKYSVPEIVREGKNGFLAKDEAEMVQKVKRIGEINRQACRADFDERFTAHRMTERYLELYRQLGAAS